MHFHNPINIVSARQYVPHPGSLSAHLTKGYLVFLKVVLPGALSFSDLHLNLSHPSQAPDQADPVLLPPLLLLHQLYKNHVVSARPGLFQVLP